LFDRIWHSHTVRPDGDAPAVLGVDLHLVHEVTSPQAFTELRSRGLRVRRPNRTIATMDHATPTMSANDGGLPVAADAVAQTATLEENCREFGVPLYALGHERQGIVHVIGPELGLTQPGMTIVCGDSHTSTHGAFGALAFGIGTSEVAHVLATQCLLQRRARTMEVRVEGTLGSSVAAKDVALAIIAKLGVGGGAGHVLEYSGSVIRALAMEGRMTVCNMSVEAGARAGMIAPDDTTISWLAGRPFTPSGAAWDAAVGRWRALRRNDDERFDRSVSIDMTGVAPMITWGTNPGMSIAIDGTLPVPDGGADGASLTRALDYMQFTAGSRLLGRRVNVVFIGSCTNARLSDLRDAAAIIRGRTVASHVRVLVVPGSQSVKREAEREGLADIFRAAGAEWRESGCSMCIAMNGDRAGPDEYVVSTSNRNFEGRQGKGSRTLLSSPATAAACAVRGEIADPRTLT
jgi:3-isopropylmalate/(R)-2-methylmalate dehydratase large subunit